MEDTYLTRAIILNRQPYREHDTRVTIYSRDRGRLDLLARGSRKFKSKLAGHLEPIVLSKLMVVKGKQFDYVGSVINENSFINIKNDLEKLSLAGGAINVFRKLVKENECDESLFSLLENFLISLNNKEILADKYNILVDFFSFKLLSELGHKPALYKCVVCENKIKPNNNKFNLNKGGVVCDSCATSGNELDISDNGIKALRFIIDNNIERVVRLKINNALSAELKNIIQSFVHYTF